MDSLEKKVPPEIAQEIEFINSVRSGETTSEELNAKELINQLDIFSRTSHEKESGDNRLAYEPLRLIIDKNKIGEAFVGTILPTDKFSDDRGEMRLELAGISIYREFLEPEHGITVSLYDPLGRVSETRTKTRVEGLELVNIHQPDGSQAIKLVRSGV